MTKDEERNRRDGGQRCQGRDVAIYVGDSRYGPFGLDFQQSVASGEVVGFPRFRQGAKAPQCGKRYVRLFATDMTQELDEEQRARIARRSALKRMPEAIDVAGSVKFLLGEGGRNITGTVITVDAGNTA